MPDTMQSGGEDLDISARENRLRRVATRQGLDLTFSNMPSEVVGRRAYRLAEANTGRVVGDRLTLDGVEHILTHGRPEVQARQALVAYVEDYAAQRHALAQEFPEDERNAHSAEALDLLAVWVRDLPDITEGLTRLAELMDGNDVVSPDQETNTATFRYGFDKFKGHGGWVPAIPHTWFADLLDHYNDDVED